VITGVFFSFSLFFPPSAPMGCGLPFSPNLFSSSSSAVWVETEVSSVDVLSCAVLFLFSFFSPGRPRDDGSFFFFLSFSSSGRRRAHRTGDRKSGVGF